MCAFSLDSPKSRPMRSLNGAGAGRKRVIPSWPTAITVAGRMSASPRSRYSAPLAAGRPAAAAPKAGGSPGGMRSCPLPAPPDLLEAGIEAGREALARVHLELEQRALLDRGQIEAGGGGLRERRPRAGREPAPEVFIGSQLAQDQLHVALRHRQVLLG